MFFFSTLYFFGYVLWRRDEAYVPKKLILPSICYGVLWSTGMVLWIVANHLLPQTVSFPIAVRVGVIISGRGGYTRQSAPFQLPAIIGALADVLLFKSIKGTRSLAFLTIAIAVGAVGVILVAISL